jgi:hypothetical protein
VKLSDYEWSHNPRGMHNYGAYQQFETSRYIETQMGWAKIVCGGGEYIGHAAELMAHNVTPVVRIWRGSYGTTYPDSGMFDVWQGYIDAGVRWFELYNEPNLDGEWPRQEDGWTPLITPDYRNVEQIVKPLMDNWLTWAEWIIARGAYPGMIALSETEDSRHASVRWAEAFVSYLAGTHRARFRNVIDNGMWIATHPYLANHFYQETPGQPATALPPSQQSADLGGWHFEYPLDPICQAHDPGRTVFGGTALTPNGDPVGLTNMGVVFNDLLDYYADGGPVPVVGTEGGIWRIPQPNDGPHVIDNRYPGYTWRSHPEATIAMFEWMAREGPPWMFGLTLWKEDDYFTPREGYGLPLVVERFETRPLALKSVPATETLSPDTGGPGALADDGTPAHHLLMLAPGLQADWFFEAAGEYWRAFRPVVTTEIDLLQYIPASERVAVTVLARSDTISYMDEQIRDVWPDIMYDPVVSDSLEEMTQLLNWRVDADLPYGLVFEE